MMQNAFKKQDDENAGLSMKELFEKKRTQTEKALEESKSGPSKKDVDDRKARLLA
jgi:hypothetical protein